MLTLRRQWPVLAGAAGWPDVAHTDGLITLSYGVDDGHLVVALNVSPDPRPAPADAEPVFTTEPGPAAGPGATVGPWSATVWFAPGA